MKSCFAILLITLFTACNSGNKNSDYENQKENLLQIEQNDPLHFLDAQLESKINLLGAVILDGTISNKATLATYKDVVIHVDFISKTNTILGNDEQTVSEFFKPGSATEIKVKFAGYKGTKTVQYHLKAATAMK